MEKTTKQLVSTLTLRGECSSCEIEYEQITLAQILTLAENPATIPVLPKGDMYASHLVLGRLIRKVVGSSLYNPEAWNAAPIKGSMYTKLVESPPGTSGASIKLLNSKPNGITYEDAELSVYQHFAGKTDFMTINSLGQYGHPYLLNILLELPDEVAQWILDGVIEHDEQRGWHLLQRYIKQTQKG